MQKATQNIKKTLFLAIIASFFTITQTGALDQQLREKSINLKKILLQRNLFEPSPFSGIEENTIKQWIKLASSAAQQLPNMPITRTIYQAIDTINNALTNRNAQELQALSRSMQQLQSINAQQLQSLDSATKNLFVFLHNILTSTEKTVIESARIK